MSALTLVSSHYYSLGNASAQRLIINGPSSYDTGGEVPPVSGNFQVESVFMGGLNTAGTGYVIQYNTQTGKVQFFESAGAVGKLAEVASTTNLSSVQFILFIFSQTAC